MRLGATDGASRPPCSGGNRAEGLTDWRKPAGGPRVQPLPFPLLRDPVTRPLATVTAASTKADIIDAALELTETQAETIADLRERQLVLWALVGVLSALLLLGAH